MRSGNAGPGCCGQVIERPLSGGIEVDRGEDGRAAQGVRVRGEGERDQRELLDRHLGGHRRRRQLRELDRALAHDVAAQDRVVLAVDDQLAEPRPAVVDDRPRERAEAPVATAVLWACCAAASVSPTEAYSGSVKLPIGLTWAGRTVFAPTQVAVKS